MTLWNLSAGGTPDETSALWTASSTVDLKAVDFGLRTVSVTSGMVTPEALTLEMSRPWPAGIACGADRLERPGEVAAALAMETRRSEAKPWTSDRKWLSGVVREPSFGMHVFTLAAGLQSRRLTLLWLEKNT